MITAATPDYKILMQFERTKRSRDISVREFKNELGREIDPQLQLELIALDMDIRLRTGDHVRADDYLFEFPHLDTKIAAILNEVRKFFLKDFCPIENYFGELPARFGDYLVKNEIGRGGMGVVYDAVRHKSEKSCAVKIAFENRGAIAMAEEARILRKLTHPNICRMYDAGEFEDLNYICFEKIEGQSLKSMIERQGPLPAQEVAWITAQIASGMQKIHEQSIVHFDLTSSNVLMNRDEIPIITDFGLAAEIRSDVTDIRRAFGSPEYMAPELFDPRFGVPGKTSDVYGLGVLMYELMTGVRPFRGSSEVLIEKIRTYPPSRPGDFPGLNVDIELEAVCLTALAKTTKDRLTSMSEFQRLIQRWLHRHHDRGSSLN